MKLLSVMITFALPLLAVTDTMTIYEISGSTQTNRPVTFQRVFGKSEFASGSCPKVLLNGTAVTTQVDSRQAWPSDGSLRGQQLSFIVPTLTASTSQAITFQATGGVCNSVGFLTTAAALAISGWGAEIDVTSTGANCTGMYNNSSTLCKANARTMMTNGDCTYWIKGPVISQFVCEDATTALTFDMGWDSFKPLHPVFILTFYNIGGSWSTLGPKVEFYLQNCWTTKLEDQTFTLGLLTGSGLTNVYSQSTFLMYGTTTWHKTCWAGQTTCSDYFNGSNNSLGAIRLDYNLAYMESTNTIPHWDLSLSSVSVSGFVTGFATSDKCDNPQSKGLFNPYQANSGPRTDLGLNNGWFVGHLYNMGSSADNNVLEMVEGQGQCSSALPVHYRESSSAANLWYDYASSVAAFGNPISIVARPCIMALGFAFSGYDTGCAAPNNNFAAVGTLTGWQSSEPASAPPWWQPDPSHSYEMASGPYYLTGDYYFLQEMWFMASGYMEMGAPQFGNYTRNRSMGSFNFGLQERGIVWQNRVATWAWNLSPDSSPEQAYFQTILNHNIAYREGEQDVTSGTFPPSNTACPGFNPNNPLIYGADAPWCMANTQGWGGYSTIQPTIPSTNPLLYPLHANNANNCSAGGAGPFYWINTDCTTWWQFTEPWEAVGYGGGVFDFMYWLGFGVKPWYSVVGKWLLHYALDPNSNIYYLDIEDFPQTIGYAMGQGGTSPCFNACLITTWSSALGLMNTNSTYPNPGAGGPYCPGNVSIPVNYKLLAHWPQDCGQGDTDNGSPSWVYLMIGGLTAQADMNVTDGTVPAGTQGNGSSFAGMTYDAPTAITQAKLRLCGGCYAGITNAVASLAPVGGSPSPGSGSSTVNGNIVINGNVIVH